MYNCPSNILGNFLCGKTQDFIAQVKMPMLQDVIKMIVCYRCVWLEERPPHF
ncbi:hypothetical protein CAL7102_01767 [Dulcicalothrix desertica PCC 7102]|nr:hypothetical protein CAL7102_01767 [Dulcicalothrix desertica PCC 7102]